MARRRNRTSSWWGGLFALAAAIAVLRLLTAGQIEWWMLAAWGVAAVYYFLRFPTRPPESKPASVVAMVEKPKPASPRQAKLPSHQQIMRQALERAGNTPNSDGLNNEGAQLTEIGILAYDGNNAPKVLWNIAIPAYATQIRPFMVINWTRAQDARVTVKFELLDDNGQTRFVAEQVYKVQRGRNFLTPSTWLPMGDDEPGGNWSLRISIRHQVLALHEFKVTPDAGAEFRAYLRDDGEIDPWLSKSAAKSITDTMSLDELIGDQAEIDIDMFRESQAQRQNKERR